MATTRMRQAVILSALVVIGIAAALFNKYYLDRLAMERAVSKEDDSALVGMPRPDFLLPDIDGFPRKISEWDGQVVALNFWASWCKPCRREMPAFIRLQNQFGSRGLQFVGIALDEREAVVSFLGELGEEINYPQLMGDDDGIDLAKSYGNAFGILPYTVFIGRDGRIAHVQYGELTEKKARELISGLLDSPPASPVSNEEG